MERNVVDNYLENLEVEKQGNFQAKEIYPEEIFCIKTSKCMDLVET